MERHFNLFLIFFLLKIFFSTQELQFDVSINMEEPESGGGFHIIDTVNKTCEVWLPSLFMPILYVPILTEIKEGEMVPEKELNLKIPFFNDNREFKAQIFKNVPFLNNNLNGILVRPSSANIYNCYFGISPRVNILGLEEENSILNHLKSNGLIVKKIFSFQEWDISSNPVKTKFYLGDSHNDFNSNTGIIGTCQSDPNDSLWGCSFKEMIFNGVNIPLTNETGQYKIYFASETHNLIFPKKFEEIIIKSSNNSCTSDYTKYLKCVDFFKDSYYVPLQLTETNENFVITGQVDSLGRFNENKDEKKDYAKIQFSYIDYIILPLMVFKEFHVQFDADNNLIRFYTNNPNILKVKEIKKGSFSGLSVFIFIFIILIVLGLGFAAFWFIKNNRKTEPNINKFSKFEDEDNYQKMNENKVF